MASAGPSDEHARRLIASCAGRATLGPCLLPRGGPAPRRTDVDARFGTLRGGRGSRRRRSPAMSQGKPVGQQRGRFFRRRAVEGHHRRRHARGAPELRSPAVAHRRDFDLIRPPANILVEEMNVHATSVRCESGSRDLTHASRAVKRSSARRRHSRCPFRQSLQQTLRRKYLHCQLLHSFCTIHTQLFHTDRGKGRFQRFVGRVE